MTNIKANIEIDIANALQSLGHKTNKKKLNRITVQLPKETIDMAKNAVFWTRGITLSMLIAKGIELVVGELEESTTVFEGEVCIKEKGQAFPQRTGKLQSGRPIK